MPHVPVVAIYNLQSLSWSHRLYPQPPPLDGGTWLAAKFHFLVVACSRRLSVRTGLPAVCLERYVKNRYSLSFTNSPQLRGMQHMHDSACTGLLLAACRMCPLSQFIIFKACLGLKSFARPLRDRLTASRCVEADRSGGDSRGIQPRCDETQRDRQRRWKRCRLVRAW